MSSTQQASTFNENNNDTDSLEDSVLFTPDLEYYTPTGTTTNIEENTIAYRSHTLLSFNQARRTILPAFLPSSFMSKEISSVIVTLIDSMDNDDGEPPLLLTNVPGNKEYSF
jgi:hypothetical protein